MLNLVLRYLVTLYLDNYIVKNMNFQKQNYFNLSHRLEFLIFDIKKDTCPYSFTPCNEARIYHVLLRKGELAIRFGNNEHLLKAGEIASFYGRQKFDIVTQSDDAAGYYLSINEGYMPTLLKAHDPFSPAFILRMNSNPIFSLDNHSYDLIVKRLNSVSEILHDDTHFFQEVMLELALLMYLMEIGNMFLRLTTCGGDYLERDRKRELFLNFMKIVRHSGENRLSVKDIASKLCISTQYLNRIVSKCSGRSVSDWLNMNITNELIRSLQTESETIQQIADRFGFPDQAALSKFFKRQTGISPSEYRRRHYLLVSK